MSLINSQINELERLKRKIKLKGSNEESPILQAASKRIN